MCIVSDVSHSRKTKMTHKLYFFTSTSSKIILFLAFPSPFFISDFSFHSVWGGHTNINLYEDISGLLLDRKREMGHDRRY